MNVISAVGCSVLLLGVLYGYTVAVRRTVARLGDGDASPSQVRLLAASRRLGIGLALLGTAAIAVRFPVAPTVAARLPTGTAFDGIAAAVAAAATTVPAVLGVIVVRRRLAAAMRPLTDREHTLPERLRHRLTVHGGLCVLCVALVFELIRIGVLRIGFEWLLPVVVGCSLWYVYLGNPYSGPASPRTRDPTADERARIERCFERFEQSADRIVIFGGDDESTPVWEAGRTGDRWTWIAESTLEDRPDEDLSVLLSQARAKNRRSFWELLFLSLFLTSVTIPFVVAWTLELAGLIDGAFLTVEANVALTVVGIGALVGVNRLLRHRCYLADERTCDRLGAERTLLAYERSDAIAASAVDATPGRGSGYATPEPERERRIERIATRRGIERPGADTGVAASADGTAGQSVVETGPGGRTAAEADATASGSSAPVGYTVWTAGIAVCLLGSVLRVVLSIAGAYPLDGTTVDDVVAGVLWIGIPLCLYMDTGTTRPRTSWPRQRALLVTVGAIPLVNIGLGCWYLWQRRSVAENGVTADDATA